MFYKLSSDIKLDFLEEEFGVPFKYPKLYEQTPIINGFNEESLSVITSNDPDQVSYAIWGMLPEGYEDTWESFQDSKNTLNTDISTAGFEKVKHYKRCLILVSGLFILRVHNGELYPYYVYLQSKKPFSLGGIYTRLDDGFLTCSVIVTSSNNFMSKINNLSTTMPLIVENHHREKWLEPSTPTKDIKEIMEFTKDIDLCAHTVSKEFYKNNILFENVLECVSYKGLPSYYDKEGCNKSD
ncbi:SOS response-associated peptidase [Aquimarina sp. M1]